MYIMTQNNKNLLNAFYIIGYEVKEIKETSEDGEKLTSEIVAVTQTGAALILGMYKDEDRAKDILMDLFINIDRPRFEMPLY